MAPFHVKALYEYSSAHEDDLKFGVGQIITITDEDDADWYGGWYTDEGGARCEGIFPRNFVERYEPTAPPRPTRPARVRRETEDGQQQQQQQQQHHEGPSEEPAVPAAAPAPPPPAAAPAPPPVSSPSPTPVTSAVALPPAAAPPPPVPKPAYDADAVASPPPAAAAAVRKPSMSGPKPSPPPAAKKPSSFQDRIAAFNKPAAPPVAPFKPSGLAGSASNFIKKPFVAPPPSRNAYVPPQREAPVAKVYRREEDPEVKEMEAEAMENAERAGLVSSGSGAGGDDEDAPKPTSLKERIALLQKQQMEAAQRQAEASAKKDKAKRTSTVGKRSMSSDRGEGAMGASEDVPPLPQQAHDRYDTESTGRRSIDEPRPTSSHHRRKLSKSVLSDPGDVAELGAGPNESVETLEEVDERDEVDTAGPARPGTSGRDAPIDAEGEVGDQDEGDDEKEEEEEVDPEVRRKEELRARMAKMSGGMGMAGMFGMVPMAGPPSVPKKKKSVTSATSEHGGDDEPAIPSRAPPVPAMMALPGMSRQDESEDTTPVASAPPPPRPASRGSALATDDGRKTPEASSRRSMDAPPPVPGSRPAPPPVPLELRSPPPPPPAELVSQRSGSESDDELSERAQEASLGDTLTPKGEVPPRIRSPPPPIPQSPGFAATVRSPSIAAAALDDDYISPPTSPQSKRRSSRAPPPIPGMAAPALPPASSSRLPPPPPPPMPALGELSRQSTADIRLASPIRTISRHRQEDDEEVTEYEGDYDTDIGSSVPHKDALKSHTRTPSVDAGVASPPPDVLFPGPPGPPPPPPPSGAPPPRMAPPPPPVASTPDAGRRSSEVRRSIDMPRGAPPPPPPPPVKDATPSSYDDEYDPYNYAASAAAAAKPASFALASKIDEEADDDGTTTPQSSAAAALGPMSPGLPTRGPPPASSFAPTPSSSSATPAGWSGRRQSLDVSSKASPAALNRRSQDLSRPAVDSDFMAEDIDLALHSGWWKAPGQIPPVLQGRRDVYVESSESTSPNGGNRTVVTRELRVLYIDYSQSTITVTHDPFDQQDVEAAQTHEPPPRALRQDQLEQTYERYGRHISEAVAGKKDTVVGDGTPLGLVHELLRPWKDVLAPVGTRAFGALVYSNLANASVQQNDEIRKGDIITIRNARFQGKHGPMHAKYSMEVGKPDHVAVVAEWDGTKKKVRAWEQGRESKKVKLESFKLDDLRSGEVKVWRVMSRAWVGWTVQP